MTSMHQDAQTRCDIRAYYTRVAELVECDPNQYIQVLILAELDMTPLNRTRIDTLLSDYEIVTTND